MRTKVKWLVNFMNPEYNTGTVISTKGDWCVVIVDKDMQDHQNPFVTLRLVDVERIEGNGKY